jgi:hypothetical protein
MSAAFSRSALIVKDETPISYLPEPTPGIDVEALHRLAVGGEELARRVRRVHADGDGVVGLDVGRDLAGERVVGRLRRDG